MVLDEPGHSYLDATLAGIAGAAATQQLGDNADARKRLTDTIHGARRVGDVIAIGLTLAAFEAVLGDPHSDSLGDSTEIGLGWRSVIQGLAKQSALARLD